MLDVIDESQGLFGADEYMDWAQIMKAEAFYARRIMSKKNPII